MQKEETAGIDQNADQLKACVSEATQHFITSLASLTEKLLLEMDDALTVDDVLPADVQIPKEKLSTLIRRNRAGRPLDGAEFKPLTEGSSRVWSGITVIDPTDPKPQGEAGIHITASVTTCKTTLGHVSAVDARDSAYSKFLQDVELELSNIQEETKRNHFEAQRWKEWWIQSVHNIKGLYM
ncbi:hypothetical protein GDO86_014907 [Hymenochirus boettgeri]|uniref:DUF4456 domain-containing protein n=1 Tax=Hymenochirus boettgeri TaxID=247094 RepID=A0A8T2JWD7_9PIPI|nr:hypothetical protein GDO86_014907 [Hymenochirus boettgeri]